MKRLFVLGAALAACLALGTASAVAAPGSVVCSDDSFSGTAKNVIVPSEHGCDLLGATVTHDVIVEDHSGVFSDGSRIGHDMVLQQEAEFEAMGGTTIGHDLMSGSGSSVHLEQTAIGGDLRAFQPSNVQTGGIGPDTPGGPVRVEHDFVIQGSPADNDFVFDGLGQLTVGRDLTITNRSVTLGFTIGGDRIGRDLVVTYDSALEGFFGPSYLVVRDNSVGRDLIFEHNTAASGGGLVVTQNAVARDALCANNDPPPSGGNVVGRTNTCG